MKFSNELNRYRAIELREGIATLPTILVLLVVIIAIIIGVTTLGFNETTISTQQNYSTQALQFAEAGARDALQRIARDKTYTCSVADCYTIDLVSNGCSSGTGCALVTVSAANGSAGTPKIITVKGRVNGSTRKVEVDVTLDSNLNGTIATTTWTELTQ